MPDSLRITKLVNIFLLLVCLIGIFGYMIYTTYVDYQQYRKREGLKKLTRKVSKTIKNVSKHTKQIAKGAAGIKIILDMLKCPVSIFSNIQYCARYYYQDKLFELIWLILWIINFVLIYIPVFVLDKVACFTFGKCWNVSPLDVCLSKKTFVRFVENIYYLLSGGGRYLHRNSSDVRKCYCTPPVILLFDPLRKFTSYFEKIVKESPNYAALIIPFTILGVLAFTQKR